MPLTNPVERELIHERTIECKGYKRKDDLWDIEGHLVDIKSYEFPNYDRNGIAAGEPIHDMWLRITVDNNMLIHEAEAVTDASPFNICPNISSIPGKKPLLLNSCHAYAANSSVVKRQWPSFYEGEE